MAVYVFSLLSGFMSNGVMNAVGQRNKMLKGTGLSFKYVFTGIPSPKDVRNYTDTGILVEDMVSVHFGVAGNEYIGNTNITQRENKLASGLLVREFYSDRLLYTEYLREGVNGNSSERKLLRRCIKKSNGENAYDMLPDSDNGWKYIFPDGEILSDSALFERYISEHVFSEEDIILIDGDNKGYIFPVLLDKLKKIPKYVFLHSTHFYDSKSYGPTSYAGLNPEYLYWFRNTEYLTGFVVSTEEQKKDLEEKLVEHGCHVPQIWAIPVCGVETVKRTAQSRKRYSLLTASRLVREKNITALIEAVTMAKKTIPELTFDIYGNGFDKIKTELQSMIAKKNAQDYIRLMGYCDMSEVYLNYEGYISASLGESYGLTLLEAASSGDAIIGLDVKYGNRLFIRHEKNGFLLEVDYNTFGDMDRYNSEVAKSMAEAIVRLFEDDEKLAVYREESYKVAEAYFNDKIKKKWLDFF